MYEMATGKKPFAGKNSLMTLDAVLHDKPVPPGRLNPKVPVELEGIIGKAMEKDRQAAVPKRHADEGRPAATEARE